MSADNFVAVLRRKATDGVYDYYVTYGNASMDQEDCQYVGYIVAVKSNRGEALEAAHNYADTLPVLEYGVSEGVYPDEKLCGHCYICVNIRGVIADDITRCDKCDQPITSGDWMVMKSEGTFHSSCEPR